MNNKSNDPSGSLDVNKLDNDEKEMFSFAVALSLHSEKMVARAAHMIAELLRRMICMRERADHFEAATKATCSHGNSMIMEELEQGGDVQADRSYVNGLRAGWNMAVIGDRAAYEEAQECRNKEIRAAKE